MKHIIIYCALTIASAAPYAAITPPIQDMPSDGVTMFSVKSSLDYFSLLAYKYAKDMYKIMNDNHKMPRITLC